MTGQEVVQRTPQAELVAQIRTPEFRSEVALALPENVTPERFVRVAITALQATPNLAELERSSVLRSLLQSAAMGLMPDGREAAIVPFKGKAQLIPMIAGFRKIAGEYGWTIYTTIAYDNDLFEYEQGLDVHFRHVPVRPGAERGDPIAAYAVGKHADGRRELEVLTVEEVEKIRATSQTARKEDGPWTQWWEQMAEKSAGKRLFKKLPLAEDDKRVRLIRSTVEPVEAAAALYGPTARAALEPGETVDLATGEISKVGGSGASDDQTEAAANRDETDSSEPAPAAASDPDDDVEPVVGDTLGDTIVPTGTHKGKTLAELAAAGETGWEWLAWATKDERPWNREGDRNAAFGMAVREFVAKNAEQTQAA